MKRLFIALLLVIFGFYTWGKFTGNFFYFGKTTLANHALSTATVFGPFSASKMNINTLTIYGYAEIDSSIIGQTITVKGPLEIYKSEVLGNMETEGPTEITDSTVNGLTRINGNLVAAKSVFNNDVTVNSKKVQLSSVTINGNLWLSGQRGEQILELTDETLIKGNVIFKSGLGQLIQEENSKIEGLVEGKQIYPSFILDINQ